MNIIWIIRLKFHIYTSTWYLYILPLLPTNIHIFNDQLEIDVHHSVAQTTLIFVYIFLIVARSEIVTSHYRQQSLSKKEKKYFSRKKHDSIHHQPSKSAVFHHSTPSASRFSSQFIFKTRVSIALESETRGGWWLKMSIGVFEKART